jgi:hypothetical protein
MIVKELIKLLKQLPKDCQELDVRVFYNKSYKELDEMTKDDIYFTNFWLDSIEVHATGSSGFEEYGEVILIGSE